MGWEQTLLNAALIAFKPQDRAAAPKGEIGRAQALEAAPTRRRYGASSASWHPSSEQLFSASSFAFRSSTRVGLALSWMLSSS